MTELPQVPGMAELKPAGTDSVGMFRSMFGDPKPQNYSQLLDALRETDINLALATIYVDDNTGEAPGSIFHGWTAEIHDDEDMERSLSTAGWPTKEALLNDLKCAGAIMSTVIVNE